MKAVAPAGLPTTIENGPHARFLGALIAALQRLLVLYATRINGSLTKDGAEAMTGPLTLATYTTATLPTASDYPGAIVYVSDGGAGARFQGSHGGAWVNLG